VSEDAKTLAVTAISATPDRPTAMPKARPAAGVILPAGIARRRVRGISLSMSRSNQQFTAPAPPAAIARPSTAPISTSGLGHPRAATIIAPSSVTTSSRMILGLSRDR
jgi:hypothetical protein